METHWYIAFEQVLKTNSDIPVSLNLIDNDSRY